MSAGRTAPRCRRAAGRTPGIPESGRRVACGADPEQPAEPATILDRLVGAGIPEARARALIEDGHVHVGDAAITDPAHPAQHVGASCEAVAAGLASAAELMQNGLRSAEQRAIRWTGPP